VSGIILPFHGYLAAAQLNELLQASISSGLVNADREQRTKGIDAGFVSGIPFGQSALGRFEHELIATNAVEQMLDGMVPLAVFLSNCAAYLQLRQLPQAEIFVAAANAIGNSTSGVGTFAGANELPELVTPEAIVGLDEMLDFAFLELGRNAGASVGRVLVPGYENGQRRLLKNGKPWVMLGTAWVVADGYVLTNHHVVNARRAGEAPAVPEDLECQARAAEFEFDFDAPGAETNKAAVAAVAAMNPLLDYAVLKVDTRNRAPLRLSKQALSYTEGAWLPVNIVQHPRGGYKKLGIRSNLVTGATASELRYFTDTDIGSSGSPVLDDNWRVVALHRGAVHVKNVSFQGKDTAFVNFGSQMRAIMDDLAKSAPALHQHIQAGQAG
jgi:endonuclease G